MKKNTLSLLILISGILISGGIIGLAHAQTTTSTDQTEPPQQTQQQKNLSNIQYPITELGNCVDKASCKTYCDNPDNTSACVNFAEQKNLFTKNEVATAKKFIDTGSKGPGGCQGKAACEQYCGDSTKLEECTAFAEKNGMMSDQQLQDSKKVLAAIKSGLKPPACGGPKQCNTYCSSSQHMEECMTFSIAAGIVPDDQKEQMQKTLDAFKQGIKPPACKPNPPDQSGQPSQPNQNNQDGPNKGQGFNPGSGVNGNGPDLKNSSSESNQSDQSGQDLQACDEYCADSSHVEECVKFSVAIGNMTEEQGKNSIKNGNKGPNGCIGKDACDTFCNNPDNQDTCFNFAKDNGMIPEADLQKMQEGQQKMKDAFSSIPPEVIDCLIFTVGADVVEKMKTGSVIGRQSGDSINQCFQKSGVWEGTPNGKGPGSGQGDQPGQNQNGQGQINEQLQPWADMCQPDGNGNPTELACADDAGGFIADAKIGTDKQPVCPAGSTAKCGNYPQIRQQGQNQQNKQGQNKQGQDQQGQQNQQKQNQQNQQGQQNQQRQNQQNQSGDKSQPGPGTINPGGQQMPQQAGPGGCKGPEECKTYCESHQEECKNFQPPQNQQGQNQPNQSGQMQPQQQPSQPNNGEQSGTNDGGALGPCGTGPGTCSGIGPDDINQQNQPDQIQPQQ